MGRWLSNLQPNSNTNTTLSKYPQQQDLANVQTRDKMPLLRLSFSKLRCSSVHHARPRTFHQHRTFKSATSKFSSKFRKYRPEIIPILTVITAFATLRSQISRNREVDNLWARVQWLTNEIQTLKAHLEEALEESEVEADEEAKEDVLTGLLQET